MKQIWLKKKKILSPNKKIYWFCHLGPSYCYIKNRKVNILFSSRDKKNISRIGKVIFYPKQNKCSKPKLILDVDNSNQNENKGVSYPFILKEKKDKLFYVGWSNVTKKKFKNSLSMLQLNNIKKRKKINLKNNVGTGSCSIMYYKNKYHLWFTNFIKWKKNNNNYKHFYDIKYATSKNLTNWKIYNKSCIQFKNKNEYAISKPTVILKNNKFHMWYCYRGKEYKIGYAVSEDGINWLRRDNDLIISGKFHKWDKTGICYPSVIEINNKIYMFYSGKKYGKSGLGYFILKNSNAL